jgi:hypothetical protein
VRKITTGVDEQGRSCIVEVTEVTTHAIPEVDHLTMASLYASESSPPPAGPDQSGHFVDTRLAPGMVRCSLFDHLPPAELGHEPGSAVMHHSAAVDLILVVEGSSRLVLQTDEIELVPGDFAITPGNDHALVTGPAGCRMLGFQIGTPTPESAAR